MRVILERVLFEDVEWFDFVPENINIFICLDDEVTQPPSWFVTF